MTTAQQGDIMANFDLESYATVQERIAQFYQDFPDGSIRTFLVRSDGPEVVFEARAYRTPDEAALGVYTSGWARELEGKTPVNRTSHVENCESSAVGRALANLGYATDARRPSRSEMLKVARMRQEHEAMLEYLRAVGPKLGPAATIVIGGQQRGLKDFVRESWPQIKEQHRIARLVVDAVEAETGHAFGAEPAAEREAA
jgi:hypothetical protein